MSAKQKTKKKHTHTLHTRTETQIQTHKRTHPRAGARRIARSYYIVILRSYNQPGTEGNSSRDINLAADNDYLESDYEYVPYVTNGLLVGSMFLLAYTGKSSSPG